MRVIIEQVSKGPDNIWAASIDPQRLIRLATPLRQGGRLNVVLVTHPAYDPGSHSLQFDLDTAILLNLGNTFDSVLIDSKEGASGQVMPTPEGSERERAQGDLNFLKDLSRLPEPVKLLGEKLLTKVRESFPGELTYAEKSGKYVETPNNFWVVRIQPRAKSLRIVVFGGPERHGELKTITLKKDQNGYSNFLIDSQHQLAEAVSVICQAKRLKGGK